MLAPSRDQSATALPFWRSNPAVTAALIIAFVSAATIAGAWFFELVMKLRPCPLCLEQRVPYYIAIPLALILALAAWRKAPRAIVIGGLIALAALMVWGAYLGGFYAGVGWKLWAGPAGCSGGAPPGPAGGLMDRPGTIVGGGCGEGG